ncbi:MAG: trimethylamine methyltransferase family protein [Deltaproteobacteria bacterium]|nr:trimethylamine methyltransferase family protein [Deltaproteobacteria bacterium]
MDIWNLKGGHLKILSQNDIEEIHQRALDVLQQVGCFFDHEEALSVFAKHGAMVDKSSRIVKLPRSMVEEAIRICPSSMLLAARDPKRDIHAEGDRVYFGPGTCPVNVIDLETGRLRKGVYRDCEDFARLIDALDYIHFFKTMITPSDVNQRLFELYMTYAAFKNTTKQISSTSFSPETAMDQYRMAVAVAGGEEAFKQRPMILINFLAVTPLSYDYKAVGGIIGAARKGYPMIIGSDPQGGTTGPAPLAGQLVLNAAETLAGITLAQLVHPNVPIMWGNIGSIADMRTGIVATGAVELGLINAAINQLAKWYRIPTYSTGGMSDSKTSDAQAGVEKALQSLTVALAGGNYIHNAAGILDFSLTCSYEQYVIDNEMLGMVARVLDGIRVTPDTLSFEQIKEVGPRGNFMGLRHTLDHIPSEHYLPRLFDRRTYDTWEANGARDIREVARDKAREILGTHRVEPLPGEVQEQLQAIIKNAEETYGR